MTNKEYLEAILQQQTLAPGSSELVALQQHREDVAGLLQEHFGDVPQIREGGSKAKGTMIKESYDLDLTCYFPHDADDADASLEELYGSVEEALRTKYQTQRKGCAIRLQDAEAGTDFHIDVVPGRFVDGEDGDVFLYPSSGDKERLKTNLDVHIRNVRNSKVIDAIRLMKLWRERNRITVKTFALELLVIKLLKEKKDKPLADQLMHVWNKLKENTEIAIEDPANPTGNDLSDLLNDGVRVTLSSSADTTLQTIEQSGLQIVFGEVESDEKARTAAIKRIVQSSPAPARPWSRG